MRVIVVNFLSLPRDDFGVLKSVGALNVGDFGYILYVLCAFYNTMIFLFNFSQTYKSKNPKRSNMSAGLHTCCNNNAPFSQT